MTIEEGFEVEDSVTWSQIVSPGHNNKVKFSEPETWAVHVEDPALAAELKEARVSDFIRRQSDRERLSRIISPVLTAKHRKEVYERIYGNTAISLNPNNAALP